MARNRQFLSQAACVVIFDGQQVSQFAEGDAIRINPSTEGSSLDKGLDGATTLIAYDPSGTAEFDLKGTSATLDQVNELWNNQQSSAARLFDVLVVTNAEEPIRLEGCSISSPGAIAVGGRTSSPRTVVLNVQNIIMPQ